MFNRKRLKIAICIAILSVFNSQNLSATEIFTGAKLLKWDRKSQEFYIRNNTGMAIVISDQNNKLHAKCLGDWLTNEESAYDEAIEAIRNFPSYHPRATLTALLEKKCGSFTYK